MTEKIFEELKRKYDETFQYPNPDGLQGKALYERRAELAKRLVDNGDEHFEFDENQMPNRK